MIRVDKPVLNDPAWLAAVQKGADQATSHMGDFRARRSFKIDDELYKRFKSFLLQIFHDKCAYCEVLLSNNQPGDVEHYRPKGRVVDEMLKPVRVRYPDLGEMEHPGYFWRAYDWDNLLPSCADCNRRRIHLTADGAAEAGKADRFPVRDFRASWVDEEDREEPLLVNPCREDPSDHFTFLKNGQIVGRTPQGEATLGLLGLNTRERMIEMRGNAFDDAKNAMGAFLDAAKAGDREQAEKNRLRINRMWEGWEAHTAMQRMALRAVQDHWANYFYAIPLPIPPLPEAVAPAR